MSNPQSGSSVKRQHPRGNVESIRGVVADTVHRLNIFQQSVSDMVVANKAANESVQELVRECKEEKRLVAGGLESIARHIDRQSTLPDDFARMHTLATDQSNEHKIASQRLQGIDQAVTTLSTRLSKTEESFASTQATLAAFAQSQVQISQTQAQILVLLRQLPPVAPAPVGPPNFYVSFPSLDGGSRKRRRLSESDDSEPAEGWEQGHVSAEKRDTVSGGLATGGQRNESRTISDDSVAARGRSTREAREHATDSGMSETMEGVEDEAQSSSPMERQPQEDELDELVSSSSPTTNKLPTGPAATNWRSTTPTGQHVPSSSDDALSLGRSSPFPAGHLVSSTPHMPPPALLASPPPAADQRPSSSSEVLAPESSLDVGPSVRSTQERSTTLPATERRDASPSLTPTVVGESSPPRVKVPLKRRAPRENRDDDDELTELAASPTASVHSPPRSTTAIAPAAVATTAAEAAEGSSSPLSPVPMTSQELLPSRNVADPNQVVPSGPASDTSSDGPPLRHSATVVADENETSSPRRSSPAAASPPQPKPLVASPSAPDPSMLAPSRPDLAPTASPRSNTRLGPNPFARAMLQSPRAPTSQASPGPARSPPGPSNSNSLGSPIRLAHPGPASPPPLPPPPPPSLPPAPVVNPALLPAPPAAASVAGRVDDRRGRILLPKDTPLDQGPSSEMSQSQDDFDGDGEMNDEAASRAEDEAASHPPSEIPAAMSDAIDDLGMFKFSALDEQPSSSDDEIVTDPRKAKHKTKSGESSRTVTPRKTAQSTPVRGSSSMTPENANRKLLSLPTLGRHATHHPSSGGSGPRSRSASASVTPVRAGRGKKGKRMLLFDDVDAEGESDDAEGEVEERSSAEGMVATGMGTGEGSRAMSLERVEMSAELEDVEDDGELEAGTQRAEEALYGALKEDEGDGLAGSWEN